MAPTTASPTASSLSAVLTVLTLLVAVWRSNEQWRPQPLFASADRPKFPFGGKRREREPVVPEPTEPDLLDEVAGGRYGGGQTLLPTLGGSTDKPSERKLPRLFPDAHDAGGDALDDSGFDDDLIGWTRDEPEAAPAAISEAAPAAPVSDAAPAAPEPSYAPPTFSSTPPAGLVPPPPPSMPGPGDANWPREMGMLEAIASLDADDDDNGAESVAGSTVDTSPWGAPPRGGAASAPSLPLEQPVLAPFSDLAPLESWEQLTPAEPPPTVSWLSFPGESRTWSTGLDGLHNAPGTTPPVLAPETGTATDAASDPDSWTSWSAGNTWFPSPDSTTDDSTTGDADEEHDRWSGVRWADPVGANETSEPVEAQDDEPAPTHADEQIDDDATHAATPTFSFALPELTEAWDAFAAREGFDLASLDEPAVAASPIEPAPIEWASIEPADRAQPEALIASSWSDIFDIFQAEDNPADPDDAFVDVYDVANLHTDDTDDTDDTDPFGGAIDDGGLRDPNDAAVNLPQPTLANVDAPIVAHGDGDRWASTLLDRLRAVVATPAEPAEALDEFNERFERGLRLRLTDQQVIDYLGQGVQMIAPEAEAHLLVGAEGASLTEMSTVGQQTRPGCGVADTDLCPAIVQDETLRFDNSTFLDACPFLSSRSATACAAVCVPIGEPGTTRGVVHITTLLNAALPDPTVAAIERSATQISNRLITLGATRRSRGAHAAPSIAEASRAYDNEPAESRA